ncbi:MAG: hypothetical protein M0C28_46335 [Candidatus Moduliflexus flocculans]|nr:hypothetical protein [Candidatus Moduliflexus flocculans]
MDHRVLVLGSVGALLLACLFLIRLVGTEFMPATDENEVRVTVEMEVGTRLEVMNKTFATVTEIVKAAVPGDRQPRGELRRRRLAQRREHGQHDPQARAAGQALAVERGDRRRPPQEACRTSPARSSGPGRAAAR